MNNARRKSITEIKEQLQMHLEELETLRDAEQEYFDNVPEGPQSSERGTVSEEAISNLESAMTDLETVIESLEEAAQ